MLRSQLAPCTWRSLLIRLVILAAGWWILSEGDRAALAFGVPVVALALGASVRLAPRTAPSWRPVGLVRYGLAFLAGSLRGGLDVARLALAPRLRLSPAIVRHRLALPAGPARHLFMATVNLMPGTLAVHLDGDDLEIHALVDRGDELAGQLRDLEGSVARALGESWERPRA